MAQSSLDLIFGMTLHCRQTKETGICRTHTYLFISASAPEGVFITSRMMVLYSAPTGVVRDWHRLTLCATIQGDMTAERLGES